MPRVNRNIAVCSIVLALASILPGCMATETVMQELEIGEFDATSRLSVIGVDDAVLMESDTLIICAHVAPEGPSPRGRAVDFFFFLPMISRDYTVDETDLVMEGRTIPLYRHDSMFGGNCSYDEQHTVEVPVVQITDDGSSDERLAQRLQSNEQSPAIYLVAQSSGDARLIYLHHSPVAADSRLVEFEAFTKRNRGSSAWALAIPAAVVVDVVTLPLQIPMYVLFAMSFGDTEEDLRH